MEQAKFTQMKDGTKEDYLLLEKHEKKFIEDTADRLIKFMSGLSNTLEGYQITRLEHSLQTATRALNDKAEFSVNIANSNMHRNFGFKQAFRYATTANPTMPIYDKGDRVRVTATFTSGGVNTDPTDDENDVTVTWRKPSGGTDATPAATKSATGIYYVDLTLAEAGIHTVRFTGDEGVIAAEIVELEVAKSVFSD